MAAPARAAAWRSIADGRRDGDSVFRCSRESAVVLVGARETTRKRGGARPHTTRGAWARYRTGDVRWGSPSSAKTATFRVHPRARASTASSSERPAPSPLPFTLLTPRRALCLTSPVSSRPGCGQLDFLPFSCRDARERSASNTEPVIDAPRPRRRCVPVDPGLRVPDLGAHHHPRERSREMIPPTDPSRLRSLSLRIPRAWCVPCAAAA